MKKTLLYLGIVLLFSSCQKEKFKTGVYEVWFFWSEDINGVNEEFELLTGNVHIIKVNKNTIEIGLGNTATDGNILDIQGNKLKGVLPVGIIGQSSANSNISGRKLLFSSDIKGGFNLIKWNGIEITGKFEMKKQ